MPIVPPNNKWGPDAQWYPLAQIPKAEVWVKKGRAYLYWHVLPTLWANADRWAVKEGTRSINNTVMFGMQSQRWQPE